MRPGYDDDSVKMNLKENVHRYCRRHKSEAITQQKQNEKEKLAVVGRYHGTK